MELRKLQSSDLFRMVRIINGIGFKTIKDSINVDEINKLRKGMTEENTDEITSQVGVSVVMSILGVVIENLPKVENDVYEFCGSVAGIKPKDVSKMELGEFMDLLVAIFKMDGFRDFFSRASKLIR